MLLLLLFPVFLINNWICTVGWPCFGCKAVHRVSGFHLTNISLKVKHAKGTCTCICKFLVMAPLYSSGSSQAANLCVKNHRKVQHLRVIQSFAAKQCKRLVIKTHTWKHSSDEQSEPQSGLTKWCLIIFSVFSLTVNILFYFTFYLLLHTVACSFQLHF